MSADPDPRAVPPTPKLASLDPDTPARRRARKTNSGEWNARVVPAPDLTTEDVERARREAAGILFPDLAEATRRDQRARGGEER
jgi:hypothetical protein